MGLIFSLRMNPCLPTSQYTSDLFFKPGPCWIYNNFTPRGWRYNSYVKILDQYGAALVKEMIQQSHMTATPLVSKGYIARWVGGLDR